jgi:hypothetical protein
LGELLRNLWRREVFDVEVFRSEFDAHGYALAVSRSDVVRHIQFKTGTTKKPGEVSVALPLARKPSGCVIWIGITRRLDLESYFWFGGARGSPLPHPRLSSTGSLVFAVDARLDGTGRRSRFSITVPIFGGPHAPS